jgi:hypothetical protein
MVQRSILTLSSRHFSHPALSHTMSNSNFVGPWADALKRINQDLNEVWQRAMPSSGGLDSPAFNAYRALFEGRKPEPERGIPGRVLEQGKAFFGFVENMAKSLAGKQNAGPQDFTDGLNQWLGAMGTQLGSGAAAQFMKPMLEPFALNLDALKDQPTFGYTREKQEKFNAMMADAQTYSKAMQAYQALIMRSQMDGAQRFQKSLGNSDAAPIDSLRGLYDAWIDSSEDAFAEAALKPEFREVYGDLVNAQMRVKRHMMDFAEGQSRDLGMPTRTEVMSLAKTVHELKRSRTELQDVKRELAELKAAVAALAKKPAAAAPAATAAPAAPKKAPSKALTATPVAKTTPSAPRVKKKG